jgi:hypothetical protein
MTSLLTNFVIPTTVGTLNPQVLFKIRENPQIRGIRGIRG